MSRVELFERIRREHRDEGVGIRALAERHRVHRRTVRQALASAVPPARKTPERPAPALGGHEATVRAWLVEDQAAPPKQRHTARWVWQRLRDERGAVVAESTVRVRRPGGVPGVGGGPWPLWGAGGGADRHSS
jgi:hypothetical protein